MPAGGPPARRVLVVEPYAGGSHRAVLDALEPALAAAGWAVDELTLPARKWKWRMRGSAITMSAQVRAMDAAWRAEHPAGEAARPGARGPWDLVFASTFVNLAELVALSGDALATVPRIVYFHENQLAYPNRHTAEWDYQFPLTNVTSALTADECWFNTRWNLESFTSGIPGLFREFPDHRPEGLDEAVRAKARVVAPPFDPAPFDAAPSSRAAHCRIVWPHRWEHDKDPDAFFAAVGALAAEGLDFEVAVAGQPYAETRAEFERAGEALGSRLVHIGAPGDRDAYAALLAGSDVAVSTALNEFFGLAMVEAAYCGCMPLAPDRLAYPELYPAEMRYGGADALVALLRSHVLHRPEPGQGRALASRFTIGALAPEYVAGFERVAAPRG